MVRSLELLASTASTGACLALAGLPAPEGITAKSKTLDASAPGQHGDRGGLRDGSLAGAGGRADHHRRAAQKHLDRAALHLVQAVRERGRHVLQRGLAPDAAEQPLHLLKVTCGQVGT